MARDVSFHILFTGFAYIIARDAHELDARAAQPCKISKRFVIANTQFMISLILLVAVQYGMIAKPPIQ